MNRGKQKARQKARQMMELEGHCSQIDHNTKAGSQTNSEKFYTITKAWPNEPWACLNFTAPLLRSHREQNTRLPRKQMVIPKLGHPKTI